MKRWKRVEEPRKEPRMVHRSRSLDTNHLTPTRSLSVSSMPPSASIFALFFALCHHFFPFSTLLFFILLSKGENTFETLESCSREYFSQVENYIESDCPRIIFNVASNSWEQLRRISLSNYIRIVMISMKITVKDNYLGMSFVFFLLFL